MPAHSRLLAPARQPFSALSTSSGSRRLYVIAHAQALRLLDSSAGYEVARVDLRAYTRATGRRLPTGQLAIELEKRQSPKASGLTRHASTLTLSAMANEGGRMSLREKLSMRLRRKKSFVQEDDSTADLAFYVESERSKERWLQGLNVALGEEKALSAASAPPTPTLASSASVPMLSSYVRRSPSNSALGQAAPPPRHSPGKLRRDRTVISLAAGPRSPRVRRGLHERPSMEMLAEAARARAASSVDSQSRSRSRSRSHEDEEEEVMAEPVLKLSITDDDDTTASESEQLWHSSVGSGASTTSASSVASSVACDLSDDESVEQEEDDDLETTAEICIAHKAPVESGSRPELISGVTAMRRSATSQQLLAPPPRTTSRPSLASLANGEKSPQLRQTKWMRQPSLTTLREGAAEPRRRW